MGRGRAKAKQTKVARDLKYNTPETDFERLQRELSNGGRSSGGADDFNGSADDFGGPVDRYADEDDWRR
ncbi:MULTISPECIES: DUF3073 domain-containing protein [Mycolicibacterium]|jgi:hypothetical protein|uniref:DUF3073 domain-containing protein n=1 Tax=Mycolicibacterium neoaurum TaxID=1795 RepID=A0AAV2WLT6_MYCNE|nr:DUF3073 domain-containing protein [Mycolicibacterium neoaurum]QVI29106.1 DUF3073 domain-containing protein [Mycolicibacterium neoaurum]TLH57362.1 DUF3073 domain-containing protein [Mycolicibacterium neoaurum]CDQ45236.1 hypothetical protein BN1047_03125 [Mycolicibacterium neoaurum]SDC38909.1 Protein of unknown function [Mycolicibacterium neoaurum]